MLKDRNEPLSRGAAASGLENGAPSPAMTPENAHALPRSSPVSEPPNRTYAPTHEVLIDIQRQWHSIERELRRALATDPTRLPAELFSTAHALQALNFPVVKGESGFQRRDGFPIIEVGEAAGPFAIRFTGQEARFIERLRAVEVPLMLRLENPLMIGLKRLTPEVAHTILSPDVEERFPSFALAVRGAYAESIELTKHRKPTEDEDLRRHTNIAITLRLKSYLNDFQSNHRASIGYPITLTPGDGETCRICAGDPADPDPYLKNIHLTPLRGRIILERLQAMESLGKFLHECYILGK